MIVKKESAWKFVTSSSGGIGVEFVVAEGGSIYLQDPSGQTIAFRYGAAGVGLSVGFKLPKIGKIQLRGRSAGAVVAPAAFPNTGKIYILETFSGAELTRRDITGACLFGEVGGGLVGGGSATAMFMGMNPLWLAGVAAAMVPAVVAYCDYRLLQSATSVLVMAGLNVGIQAGGGAGIYIGGLM